MAASISIDTLIAHGEAVDFTNTQEASEFFAECYRFGEIEQFPELKESGFMGLAKIDSLDGRRQYVETCLSQCNAIKTITVVTTPPTTT